MRYYWCMQPAVMTIDNLSAQVNRLTLSGNGHSLGTATGFIVKHGSGFYLVTNWHVLSGRSPHDNQPLDRNGVLPDKVEISMLTDNLQSSGTMTLPLTSNNGNPYWLTHPQGKSIDIAALKLDEHEHATARPLNIVALSSADLLPQIGMTVTIIGFPFGESSFNQVLPIWKTGHIASEPEVPFNDKPATLIDATTRSGMSGSPVFIRSSGPHRVRSSDAVAITSGLVTLFIGIYSGRLRSMTGNDSQLSSELGIVWKPEAIIQTLDQ